MGRLTTHVLDTAQGVSRQLVSRCGFVPGQTGAIELIAEAQHQ